MWPLNLVGVVGKPVPLLGLDSILTAPGPFVNFRPGVHPGSSDIQTTSPEADSRR